MKLVFAWSVVNVPAPGVVPPIGPGAAQVFPRRSEAFRLGMLLVEATTRGGVPLARVLIICPENVPVVAENPEEKLGTPENMGLPLHVPVSDPPPAKLFGPKELNPTLKFTGPLKVPVAFQVWFPSHVLFVDSKELLPELIPSSLKIWVPVEQFVPPAVTSLILYAWPSIQISFGTLPSLPKIIGLLF